MSVVMGSMSCGIVGDFLIWFGIWLKHNTVGGLVNRHTIVASLSLHSSHNRIFTSINITFWFRFYKLVTFYIHLERYCQWFDSYCIRYDGPQHELCSIGLWIWRSRNSSKVSIWWMAEVGYLTINDYFDSRVCAKHQHTTSDRTETDFTRLD